MVDDTLGGSRTASAPATAVALPATKVFIFYNGRGDNLLAQALCEDGHGLGSHISSSPDFARYDIGESRADKYAEMFPNGYELIWLGSWTEAQQDADFAAAVALNKTRFTKEPDGAS